MYCVQCREPVAQLYQQYKSAYIKLTQCSRCQNIADKYIEYDHVLLFIDVLLLKKGALLHLANLIEKLITETQPRTWWQCYTPHARVYIMAVLFEVYLQWATAERASDPLPLTREALTHLLFFQYGYFMLNSVVQHVVQVVVITRLFAWLGWGSNGNKYVGETYQRCYFMRVLIMAILVTTAIKLFPIISLIWPYDAIAIPTLVTQLIGIATLTEALHLVTEFRYSTIIVVLLVLMALQEIVTTWALTFAVNQVASVHYDYSLTVPSVISSYLKGPSRC